MATGNLFRVITSLRKKQEDLERYLRHAQYTNNLVRYQKLIVECNQVKAKLREIGDSYIITPINFEKILSDYTHEPYKLKSFRETEERDGRTYYTSSYVICYLNKENKFFNAKFEECNQEEISSISLDKKEYEELLISLYETNSYVLSGGDDNDWHTLVDPVKYIEHKNILRWFTYAPYDNMIHFSFPHLIRPMLQQKLETIIVDDNLNPVNTDNGYNQ